MKRSRKSKGVSWAHGVNLCQVKLFSSEDCPSKVGLKSPDHLQAKTPWMLHPYSAELNDCPPGFEVVTPLRNQLADISCSPLVKWTCPLKFVMNPNWCVRAGEESIEVESQKLREMRLLEAVYPRASAIPPGATVSTDIEDELYDDSLTPLVPIIPIEEDESEDLGSDSAVPGNFSMSSLPNASNFQLEASIPVSTIETSAGEKPIEKLADVGVDVAVAASTAYAVLKKSMEQGSLIDTNLLIKIFKDPKMIQNLSNNPLSVAVSGSPPPISLSKPVSESVSLSLPKSNTIQRLSNGFRSSVTAALPQMNSTPTSNVNLVAVPGNLPVPDPNEVKTVRNAGNYSKIGSIPAQGNISLVSSVRKEAQQMKDLSYYKNLVRQHGDQRDFKKQKLGQQDGNNYNHHHNLNMVNEMKLENLKPKMQKQCIYFNGPRGCRNGINCQFKHDITLKNQNTKRMKPYGEVTRRT